MIVRPPYETHRKGWSVVYGTLILVCTLNIICMYIYTHTYTTCVYIYIYIHIVCALTRTIL